MDNSRTFFRWLAHTHAVRREAFAPKKTGRGRLYQGRYKSFLIQRDENLLTILRYVERTPLAAGLVAKAQQWRFSSLWARLPGAIKRSSHCWHPGPGGAAIKRWTSRVNASLSACWDLKRIVR